MPTDISTQRREGARDAGARSATAAFKAIDDKMRMPGSACGGALDYMEQSSWLLFLRYIDAHEEERRLEAQMLHVPYVPALPEKLRWSSWAYPRMEDGSFDYDRAPTGDELIRFVNLDLFPNLARLAQSNPVSSIQYRIGKIFENLNCRFTDGYLLREVIALMEPLKFQTEEERHELSVLYEERLADMGNAGRAGGQYYTPRPLIRSMIRLLDPAPGETFDDSACGSGGFLCEAFVHMREKARSDADAYKRLQSGTITGGEAKPIAFLTAQMNCILHGLEAPSIRYGDTLMTDIANFESRDRVDVIGANPPFGANVDDRCKAKFTVSTSESALLFMEYFIAKLKRGGRAAVIIKNTFLSNADNGSIAIRKMLLSKCRLHWILDLPQKVFTAGVHTVVLFFTKDGPTTEPINCYQLDLKGVNLGKKRPLLESDLAEFESLAKGFWKKPDGDEANRAPGDVSSYWTIDPATLDQTTFDLSLVNPNVAETKTPTAAECEAEIQRLYAEIGEVLSSGGAGGSPAEETDGGAEETGESREPRKSRESRVARWPLVRLGDVCEVRAGADYKDVVASDGQYPIYGTGGIMGRASSYRCPANSVIVGRKGTLNNPLLVKEPFWNIDTCFGLIPNEILSAEYLWFFCLNFDFYALCPSSGRPSTTSEAIRAISLPLPPLSVQRSIVARLDAARERCDKLARLARAGADACAALRKAILKEAFE
ncbi:MAG: N-6 DNA methylase [Kiritimatiellae bacterium]|nr:N-6 DNA methylase [Kiritimatiellia bacterium]